MFLLGDMWLWCQHWSMDLWKNAIFLSSCLSQQTHDFYCHRSCFSFMKCSRLVRVVASSIVNALDQPYRINSCCGTQMFCCSLSVSYRMFPTPQLSTLEAEELWDGWPRGKSWLPGASPGSDDWFYVIRSPHFTSFSPTSSPLWASPDAMSAKWTIQKSWEISQLRLPLMEMVIRLNDLLKRSWIPKWYLI